MDLFKEACKLGDTAKNTIQESVNSVSETFDEVKTSATSIINTSLTNVDEIKKQSNYHVQQSFDAINQAVQSLTTVFVDSSAAGMVIANSLKDLPKNAEELAREMPQIAQRLRYRAGIRVGDAPRSDADVMKLFEKIPGTSKFGAKENTIRQFLSDKQGSHIYPRSQGGSNAADNILWEVGADTIRFG